MLDQTKQFTRTLPALIRPHGEKHGLIVAPNDFLVAYDPVTGRIVVTFLVEPIMPIKQAAE